MVFPTVASTIVINTAYSCGSLQQWKGWGGRKGRGHFSYKIIFRGCHFLCHGGNTNLVIDLKRVWVGGGHIWTLKMISTPSPPFIWCIIVQGLVPEREGTATVIIMILLNMSLFAGNVPPKEWMRCMEIKVVILKSINQ